MAPPSSLELHLSVPRWQRTLAWGMGGVYVLAASLAARNEWHHGVRGFALWVPFAARVLQGALLQQVGLRLDAKVLVVEDGCLTVTTRFRRPFGRPRFVVPIREAALEWIDRSLVIQTPDTGMALRLGYAPTARTTAEWLIARGARPPVGG
jgi:hypothetical protein